MYNAGYSMDDIANVSGFSKQEFDIPYSEQIQCRFEQRTDQRTETEKGNRGNGMN